jgi:hypothetical protein
MKKLTLLLVFMFCFLASTFASLSPYRAIVDLGVYYSNEKIIIVQNVYAFDYEEIFDDSTDPVEVLIIEKRIENSKLVTKEVSSYKTYMEAMIALTRYENISVLRPVIHLDVEKLAKIISIDFLRDNVSSLYNKDNIMMQNISTLYAFDGIENGIYDKYYLVQVDYIFFIRTNWGECYRKTVLISSDDLNKSEDTKYFK